MLVLGAADKLDPVTSYDEIGASELHGRHM